LPSVFWEVLVSQGCPSLLQAQSNQPQIHAHDRQLLQHATLAAASSPLLGSLWAVAHSSGLLRQ
jgi:hypothetical protein